MQNVSVDELKQLQLKIIGKNKKCNLVAVIAIAVALVLTAIWYLISKADFRFAIVLALIEVGISILVLVIVKSLINGSDIKVFNKEFKDVFVLKYLRQRFDDVVYRPGDGIGERFVESVGMLDTGDRFSSNDYISGKYKGINFEQSDVHIEERHETTDKDGNKIESWKTIFKGRLMIFDFNKSFKANIQVSSRDFSASRLPWKKRFSKIKMEDVEFNKNFSVYSENDHDAFYILTPHFMQKIKEITKKMSCGVMFGFVDSRLHIAVDNREDSFEYDVFDPIDEQEIIGDTLRNIKIITAFVDELDLNNNLFRKGV